jgi:hypothetical protein
MDFQSKSRADVIKDELEKMKSKEYQEHQTETIARDYESCLIQAIFEKSFLRVEWSEFDRRNPDYDQLINQINGFGRLPQNNYEQVLYYLAFRKLDFQKIVSIGVDAIYPLSLALQSHELQNFSKKCLLEIGGIEAGEVLKPYSEDKEILSFYGKLSNPLFMEVIYSKLQSKNFNIQMQAANIIQIWKKDSNKNGWIPRPFLNQLEEINYLIGIKEWASIKKFGKEAIDPLKSAAKNVNRTGNNDSESNILLLLIELGENRALIDLLELYRYHSSTTDIKQIQSTISKIGPTVITPIISYYESLRPVDIHSPEVRNILDLLVEFDNLSVKPIISAILNTHVNDKKMYLIKILGKIGSNEAIDALIGWLSDDSFNPVKSCIINTLGESKSKQASASLIRCLNIAIKERSRIREELIPALGKIDDKSALIPLYQNLKLKDWTFPLTAKVVLEMDRNQSIPIIIRYTNDKNEEIRNAARSALQEIGIVEFPKKSHLAFWK